MSRKSPYRTVDVKSFTLSQVLPVLTVLCIVSMDVAKSKQVVALSDEDGNTKALLRLEHPRQTGLFLELLKALREAGKEVHVVMEPTTKEPP